MNGDIRLLNSQDARAFRKLRLFALQESPAAFGSSYEEEAPTPVSVMEERLKPIGNPPERFSLGAFSKENELVGIAFFLRQTKKKERHKGWIYGIYVSPEARGAGFGKRLMVEVIQRAQILPGLRQINLSVVASMDAAHGLYKSLGFQTYGVEKDGYFIDSKYYDIEFMAMKIQAASHQ